MRRLALAAAVLALPLPAAHAAPHADVAAQQQVTGTAGGTPYAGSTCGLWSINDPTSLILQDPNLMTGQLIGGPMQVADPTVLSTTLFCSVQVNQANHGGFAVAAVALTQPGSSGSASGLAQYHNTHGLPPNQIYVCTVLSWAGASGGVSVAIDMSPAPGDQCALALSV